MMLTNRISSVAVIHLATTQHRDLVLLHDAAQQFPSAHIICRFEPRQGGSQFIGEASWGERNSRFHVTMFLEAAYFNEVTLWLQDQIANDPKYNAACSDPECRTCFFYSEPIHGKNGCICPICKKPAYLKKDD